MPTQEENKEKKRNLKKYRQAALWSKHYPEPKAVFNPKIKETPPNKKP